jgi:hypothetical protein
MFFNPLKMSRLHLMTPLFFLGETASALNQPLRGLYPEFIFKNHSCSKVQPFYLNLINV